MQPRVYLSATRVDLKDHIAAARTALRQLGVIDVAMENYTASTRPTVEKCVADVRSCDLYLGVFAWRYGSCAKGHELSYTESELRAAEAAGMDLLIFLLDDQHPWSPLFFDSHMRENDSGRRIDELREELSSDGPMPALFTTPDSLATVVATATSAWMAERPEPLAPRVTSSPRLEYLAGLGDRCAPLHYAVALHGRTTQGDADHDSSSGQPPEFSEITTTSSSSLAIDVEVGNLLAVHRQAVLLGPPGAGKSTSLELLAAQAVENATEDEHALVPLLVHMSDWPASITDFRVFLTHEREMAGAPHLPLERFIFFLDGLNEMDAVLHDTRLEAISRWLAKNRSARVYLTSRPESYYAGPLLDIPVMTLRPLAEADVRAVVDQLLTSNEAQRYWEELERLGLSPESGGGDQALITNPYLLRLTLFVFESEGHLPQTQGALFDQFLRVVERREGERHPQSAIDALTSALERAAASVIGRGASNAIPISALAPVDHRETADVRDLLPIAHDLGLVVRAGRGRKRFRFVHDLLLAYFAARAIRHRPEVLERMAEAQPREERRDGHVPFMPVLAMLEGVDLDDAVLAAVARTEPLIAGQLFYDRTDRGPAPPWLRTALLDELGASRAQTRADASRLLTRLGDEMITDLAAKGTRDDGIGSKMAVATLGAIGSDAALASLASITVGARYRWARREADESLIDQLESGQLTSDRLVSVLRAIPPGERATVARVIVDRAMRARLLDREGVGRVLVAADFDADTMAEVQESARASLGATLLDEDDLTDDFLTPTRTFDAEAAMTVALLIDELARLPGGGFAEKRRISRWIGAHGRPVIPLLLAALRSPDEVLRRRVIRIIGSAGEQAVAPRLIDRHAGETASVQREILIALVRTRSESAVPLFRQELDSVVKSNRQLAALGLSWWGDADLDERMFTMSASPSAGDRKAAAVIAHMSTSASSAVVLARLRADSVPAVAQVALDTGNDFDQLLRKAIIDPNFVVLRG